MSDTRNLHSITMPRCATAQSLSEAKIDILAHPIEIFEEN